MMEEMYGLHSSSDYSNQNPPVPMMMMQGMETTTMLSPADYPATPVFPSFRNRIPLMVGSEQLFSASSAVSDATSIIVSEIQRGGRGSEDEASSTIRAKVASHPLYPKLLEAYIDCQKVGAPPEIAYVLDGIRRESDISRRAAVTTCLGADPELDDFMETYCNILMKYKSDLARPFDQATMFLNNIETQLNNLCNGSSISSLLSEEAAGSSSEDLSGGESVEMQESQRTSEERELKDNLLRKYSGYISTLKHEFSKKKKKGKLPREARQTLLDWWNVHYKWPYPTEVDKIVLAESTGLDQKQINNWFINQRKRHWKPSENMQFAVMDTLYGPLFTSD